MNIVRDCRWAWADRVIEIFLFAVFAVAGIA